MKTFLFIVLFLFLTACVQIPEETTTALVQESEAALPPEQEQPVKHVSLEEENKTTKQVVEQKATIANATTAQTQISKPKVQVAWSTEPISVAEGESARVYVKS